MQHGSSSADLNQFTGLKISKVQQRAGNRGKAA